MGAEERSRRFTWAGPQEFLAALRSGRYRTGLELLQAMLDGHLPRPPIAELLDYWPVEFSDGRSVFECVPREYHYNPLGVAHGGLAAALCDTAMACAIHTRLPAATAYTTLELKVNYIRPMTEATGTVRCIGQAIHVGKRTATADCRLEDKDGQLLAHGTTTCLTLP
jgi:uncharacterized protein (TIGR00369 family)